MVYRYDLSSLMEVKIGQKPQVRGCQQILVDFRVMAPKLMFNNQTLIDIMDLEDSVWLCWQLVVLAELQPLDNLTTKKMIHL